MSDELRAAAELIRSQWDARPPGIFPTEMFLAAIKLAAAYLAENSVDGGEPVTAEWLESIGYSDSMNMRETKRYEIVDGIRVMLFACEGPRCWRSELWVGSGRCYVSTDLKRRQIMQLIAALGIEVVK